ncbi:MAG TPA: single-stranded-DNA-specific exonuclease RecJ [Polyangiaceae bacterium]|nr:single-stranded-DNA-specific exonuclease RecJ [Polyangiaceae bacterium]
MVSVSVSPAPIPATTDGPMLELASRLGVTATIANWLARRGLSDVEAARRFLAPRLAALTPPDAMADRSAAAERIAHAVRRREKIAVFGDYDCDGMTAAAIMTEVLTALDGDVVTFVGSRFEGGYGLAPAAVERLLASGASLVVTCDCGSSDHAALERLRERGVESVVIDHHLVPSEPLPALAFLNPHRPDCGFPFKGLASCGLALSIGAAIRTALGRTLDLKSLLDLVAIGTIADVAPLVDDNRALVRAGLALLGEARRPGLRALCDLAGIAPGAPLGSDDVSFRIAPRLNAPGRLGSPEPALQLLLERNRERAEALAATLESVSLERRALQDRMLDEALAEIREEGYEDRGAIVLGREGWGTGIVGIVAGRLADRFARPVVVVGFENGQGRGSVRGPRGARLHDALGRTSELLVRFGGHQAAAGLELELVRLAEFREAFEAAVAVESAPRDGVPASPAIDPADGVLRLVSGDSPNRVLADLALLEPCGLGNPHPEIELEADVLVAREVTGGHLKLELDVAGARLGAFGVGMGARASEIGKTTVLSGRLRRDTYRGGDAVELKITRLG